MSEQLVLPVSPAQESGFASYIDPSDGRLLFSLKSLLQQDCFERFVYLWGALGLGKTHLLKAVVEEAHVQHMLASYVDCAQFIRGSADELLTLEQKDLIALDNVELLAGHRQHQEAVFTLYNRVRDNGRTRFIVASDQSPGQLPLELADLKSRLAWGVSFKLGSLNEAMKKELLQRRAYAKGFELSDQMTQYILTHHGREQQELVQFLDQLDIASLQAQRKITIPFIRSVLRIRTDQTHSTQDT